MAYFNYSHHANSTPISSSLIKFCALLSWLPCLGFGASLHQNLIVNGDAELGSVSSSEGDMSQQVVGWTQTQGHMVVLAHENKFDFAPDLDPDPDNPLEHGKNFFYGGQTTAPSVIEQTIDVSPLADRIQTGEIVFELSGWLGGWRNHVDAAELIAEFRDDQGNLLSTDSIGPVTPAERSNQTGYLYRLSNGAVPAATSSVLVRLVTFPWQGANNNDGMADNLALVLSHQSDPPQPYADWIDEFYPGETDPELIAAAANPSDDSLPNLLKWTLGLPADTPASPTNQTAASIEADHLIITHHSNPVASAAGAELNLEFASSPAGPWLPLDNATEPIHTVTTPSPQNPSLDLMTHRIPLSLFSPEPQGFVRLAASQP